MQRFLVSDLERLADDLAKMGFKIKVRKVEEREGKPPYAMFAFFGKGTIEAVHDLLRGSPFLMTGMDSKVLNVGLNVRLELTQRAVLEDSESQTGLEFGDAERYGAYAFGPEMDE